MIDLVAASPSFASSAAAPASRLPWSSSSPPSPIELWHVARGAAAARTAAAAAAAPAASEEEAEDEEEEVFGPSRSCSVSLRDGPGEETGWRGSLSHENEGEVGGRGEGDDKEEDGRRVCSSPEDDDDDPWQPPQRNRRSSLGRSYRSSSPSISLDEGETCRDVRPLEDLIGSMLAMTGIGQQALHEDEDEENTLLQQQQREDETKRSQRKGSDRQRQQRLCACCGKPRKPRRRVEESASAAATATSATATSATAASADAASAAAASAAAAAAADDDKGESSTVLSERDANAAAAAAAASREGWNYRVDGCGEAADGEERKASPLRKQRSPHGLPLRRRRRGGGTATFDSDSTRPNFIVDRVARFEELSAIWAGDPFLAAGGDTRSPRRAGRGLLAAAFAAEHALLGGGGGVGSGGISRRARIGRP